MSLWDALREVVATAGQMTGLTPLVERIGTAIGRLGADRGPVAFTVALIALSAKMAKADGIVSVDEVQAFRHVVEIPPEEADNVHRLFELAQKDVAGYEAYAQRIAALAEGDALFLGDVLDGLFAIATADAFVHHLELDYIARVAEIFGFDERAFERIAARHVRLGRPDPYRILGVAPDATDDEVKRRWRTTVSELHPDRHFAKGLPAEAIALLTDRLQQANEAYEQIRSERGLR